MGWAQKPAVNRAGTRSTARPVRRARGTSTGRCRPITRGVEAVSLDQLSSPSVSVHPPMRRDGALVAEPAVDVVASRIDLERLYVMHSQSSSSPGAARTEMERVWQARSRSVLPPRRTVERSATKRPRRTRCSRNEARPVQNTVLSVAEQFLRGMEQEVADAEVRYAQAFRNVFISEICMNVVDDACCSMLWRQVCEHQGSIVLIMLPEREHETSHDIRVQIR